MIKLVFCVTKRADMPQAEFHDYWLNQHGPLVRSRAADLNIKRYVQSHVTLPDVGQGIASARGMKKQGFDGIAELWWEDPDSLQAALGTDAGQAASALLAEDELNFIDMEKSTIFLSEEHQLV
jgi:uncharacterized protein (TIGR02118 family)